MSKQAPATTCCPQCGNEEVGGSAFCSACGTALGAVRCVDVAEHIGRNCPYCRFPLKAGVEVMTCPDCHAVHHADCYQDNRGCAVMGCDAAVPVEPPTLSHSRPIGTASPTVIHGAPFAAADVGPGVPARAPRRGLAPLIAGACALLAVVAAVVAVVVVESQGKQVTVPVGVQGAGSSQRATSGGGSSAGNSSQAGTSGDGSSSGSGDSSGSSGQAYQLDGYSVTPPSGFVADSQEVQKDGYTESRWHLASDPNVVFRVDHTVGSPVSSPEAAGEGVREQVSKASSYKEVGWQPTSTTTDDAWQWSFKLNGDQKVDTFVVACGSGYAALGGAPEDRFGDYEAAFLAATKTLRPACE